MRGAYVIKQVRAERHNIKYPINANPKETIDSKYYTSWYNQSFVPLIR